MNARYLCTDMRGRKMFAVSVRHGFLWRKESRKVAFWDSEGWCWEDGTRITSADIRISLCEAALKVGFLV